MAGTARNLVARLGALGGSDKHGTQYEFCTLFDVNYLPRGLVLWRSLTEVCSEFRLRVFCMDDRVESILDKLALPNVVPISLAELENHDPWLRAVKPTRSQLEYCWTAYPAICLYALQTEPELEMITYLDADLMFVNDPAPLFDELNHASVGIVGHRFAARFREFEQAGGPYNAGYISFRNDKRGLGVLQWWRERCLEWCYDRFEAGRWSDQRYLDDWPERFADVHVLKHPGAGIGPWNACDASITGDGDHFLVDGQPVIFLHYASMQLFSGMTWLRRCGFRARAFGYTSEPVPLVWKVDPDFQVSRAERDVLWSPYMRRVSEELFMLRQVVPGFSAGLIPLRGADLVRQAYEQIKDLLPDRIRGELRRARHAVASARRRRLAA